MKSKTLAMLFLVCVAGIAGGQTPTFAQTGSTVTIPGIGASHPLKGVSVIPMRMNYNPLLTALPIVYCRINGSEPKPFLFDTGYSGTILINEDEAKKLNLKFTDSPVTTTDNNGVSEKLKAAQVKSVEGLTIGGTYFDTNAKTVYVSNIPTNDENLYPTPAIGVIGLDLFWGATLYFDFDQQELLLIPDDHPDLATAEGAISAPFSYDGKQLKVDTTNLFGTKESMILDTGAVKSFLSHETIQRLKPVESFDAYAPGAFKSYAAAKMYFFDTVPFQGVMLKNLLVGEARSQKAILGADILSRFRLTIDTRREEIVLEPTRGLPFRNAKALGRSGLEVARRSGDIYITGAVDKYKNLIGYQLVRINDEYCKDKLAKNMPVAQVQSLLDGYVDTEVTIIIRAKGVDRTISIRRMTVPDMYRAIKQMKQAPK